MSGRGGTKGDVWLGFLIQKGLSPVGGAAGVLFFATQEEWEANPTMTSHGNNRQKQKIPPHLSVRMGKPFWLRS
jgi:hypothetical protein